MKDVLYREVALTRDIPEYGLSRGGIATVVEHLPATKTSGGEPGYVLEIFNAVGESIAVVAVPVSAVEPFKPTQVLTARPRLVSAEVTS